MKKCQRCSERPVIHITELEGKAVKEIHLCYKHAQEYLRENESAPAEEGSVAVAAVETISSDAKCPLCHLTFDEFRSSGRLGCPNDYEVFRNELGPLLENVHGALRHSGKVPKHLPADAQIRTRLMQLRQELQQAVAVEDYEKAARLRDRIGQLESAGL